MTLLLQDRDYVLDGEGHLKSLTGMEEVLQRVLILLTARRGSFPLLPRLGSRLYLLLRHTPTQREALAKQYVLEALQDETDLTVTGVSLTPLAGNSLRVDATLEYNGETVTAGVEVRE